MKVKISIIGAGNVGATTAELLALSGFSDVVLIDVLGDVAKGKAIDIACACPLWGSSSNVYGSDNYDDTKNSQIVVVTAGLARKPGMSRDDLLTKNAEIIKDVCKKVSQKSPDAIIIVVTNPMDAMAALAHKVSGFDASRIIGMGGVLDSTRFRAFIAAEARVSVESVEALVLGGHGDLMVPLPRFTTIGGVPITEFMKEDKIEALVHRTRNGGAEIVKLLGSGSAYYAPAAAIVKMVNSIYFNERQVLPVSCYLDGQYGLSGVFVGVPAVIGGGGIEEIVELALLDNEKEALNTSAQSVRGLMEKLGIL